jgi:hypothetical protein
MTGNLGALLDAETQRLFLAHRITNNDRMAYQTFLTATGVAESFHSIANIADYGYSTFGSIKDMLNGNASLGQGAVDSLLHKNTIEAAMFYTMYDMATSWEEVWNDDFIPLGNRIKAWREDNPDASLQVMRDHFLKDGGINGKHPEPIAKKIIDIALGTFVGAVLTGSLTFPWVAIATSLALYSVNFYADFFQYVAWINLRYSYSGRYAMRVYEDLFNFRYVDMFETEWELLDWLTLYDVTQHE